MARYLVTLFALLSIATVGIAQTVAPKVLDGDHPKRGFLIPVAVSAQGVGGTFFRTDLTLANYRNVPQKVLIAFSARGRNNSAANGGPAASAGLTLGPGVVLTVPDVVATLLNTNGLGSLNIFAVSDDEQSVDPLGLLDANARIWTLQPGSAGSVSQTLPALNQPYLVGSNTGYALGLKQTGVFRTNVGVVNQDTVAHNFSVVGAGTRGQVQTVVTVQGSSIEQIALPPGDLGDVLVTVTPDALATSWAAYASSVDGITGDAWTVIASQ